LLRGNLVHPEILQALGGAGHGSKVLIADANYPIGTKRGVNARIVHLNLAPGVVSGVQALEAILSAIHVEAAWVMQDDSNTGETPTIWSDYRSVLESAGFVGDLETIDREAFYRAAADEDVALEVATGEGQLFANLLLVVGVVS